MAEARVIPNFFIVGAPKCGTTALYTYLGSHPKIFMPEIKEPHYFCTDFPNYGISTLDEYLKLFVDAPPDALVGEASTMYLYSCDAIPQILAFNPKAKIIAMLRNPVDMAYSLHSQRLFNLDEDVSDFIEAWSLQPKRLRGTSLPMGCRDPKLLQYKEICTFSPQMLRLINAVPELQRKIIIYEEFFAHPRENYLDILKFLELPDDGRIDFPKVRGNKVILSRKLHRAFVHIASRRTSTYFALKKVSNYLGLKPGRAVTRLNVRSIERAPLDPKFRAFLQQKFANDIEKVESILGRSLECWRSNADVQRPLLGMTEKQAQPDFMQGQ